VKSTGDILYGYTKAGGTVCIDYNAGDGFALPYNYSYTANGVISGGTGKLAGSTGTFTNTGTGQIMSSDYQGHNFGWNTGTTAGTTP